MSSQTQDVLGVFESLNEDSKSHFHSATAEGEQRVYLTIRHVAASHYGLNADQCRF